MKIEYFTRYTTAGLLVAGLCCTANAALLVDADFEGASDSTYDENPEDQAVGDGVTLAAGPRNGWTITRNSDGASVSGFRSDGGANGAGATSPDFPSRLEGGRTAWFTLVVDDQTLLDLDRIVFDVRGGTNGTGRDVQFRTSLEGETDYLYENLDLPGRTSGNWTNVDLTLSDSKYDGLTDTTIDIIFRTPGGAIDLDTIEVYGTTAPVPEPSSLALLGLGGLLIARRRK